MDLSAYLSGDWQIKRTLDGIDFFIGTGSFRNVEAGHRVRYREDGVVHHKNGYSASAFREYVFSIHPEGCGFSVYFDSECTRLFHHIQLEQSQGALVGKGTHLCCQDLYTSRYTFENERWIWEHSVKGPAKDYSLKALYSRHSS